MMKKKIIASILVVAAALTMAACGKEEKVKAERGVIEENVYTNKSMGVQATLPEGCTLLSDEEIKAALGVGSDMVKDSYDSESVDESLERSIYDVMAVTADQAANIQIMMEDTSSLKEGGVSAEDYVEGTYTNIKTVYENAGMTVPDAKPEDVDLGGVEFSRISVDLNGMVQEYYVHQVSNNVFVITVTYTEPAAEAIQQFLDSVKAVK